MISLPANKPDPYLANLLDRARERLSIDPSQMKPVAEHETFIGWCERLAAEGLRVDGRKFSLTDRSAMGWIYQQVPSTAEEAYRYVLVLQKSAQVGFTIMEMLAAIYLGLKFGPCTVGMFMPDQQMAAMKSSGRFMHMVKSIPSVHNLMRDPVTRRLREGNLFDRRLGGSRFVYLWTSGRNMTESIPMDIVSLDEVQEMDLESIEKVVERLSASPIRFLMMGSTANEPDGDINYWYRLGSQYRFHTRCPTCGSEAPLDEYFPQCIRREGRRAYYVCPDGHRIDDPQIGEWKPDHPELEEAHDPEMPLLERPLRIRSIHFPQTLSPTISPRELLDAYYRASSLRNFYNRKLGRPFLDPTQTPVTLTHLNACVAAGREAGAKWLTHATDTFMGIDQMGQHNVVWVKKRLDSGHQQLVHLEEIYSEDPFMRCAELMDRYSVRCCVLEANPNYNEAKRFAHRFPGRVFLCDSFGPMDGGMIEWRDALSRSDRRTEEDARDRYTVRIDQVKCMQTSMARFVRAECLLPDPRELVQQVVDKGEPRAVEVLTRAFTHIIKTTVVVERDEKTQRWKRAIKKIGLDPHHSYANMLCDIAMARVYQTASFLSIDPPPPEPAAATIVETVLESVGVPPPEPEVTGEICGACVNYPRGPDGGPQRPGGFCPIRNFTTQLQMPGCPVFKARA